MKRLRPSALFMFLAFLNASVSGQENLSAPRELRHWLKNPQPWERDTDRPVVELGEQGSFDDTHIFAPTVAWTGKDRPAKFYLWYPGSRGSVRDRVFRLGLTISDDGREFSKHGENPVFSFGDAENRQSVLTPCLLRDSLGRPEKIEDEFVLYFSATDFHDPSGRHTLHRTTSKDGIKWSKPGPALLENCYSPTLVKTGRLWQLWYTDVSGTPWIFRKAESSDGLKWRVHPEPIMALDQDWERTNLFYPHVIKPSPESPYLMWYGSYLARNQHHTALGFAVSLDGVQWHKHPQNPVFEPDPERPWESHYVTSHSIAVLPNENGSHDFRIWYASRKAPPFENKYFALNTAIWKSPEPFNRPLKPSPSVDR